MHAQARNNVYFGGVVPVTLLVVVDSLELVLLLLVQVAHLREDFRVCGHLSDKDVVPLEGLPAHANQFINVGNLVDNFIRVRNNSMQFFKRLQGLIIITEALVNKT